VTVKFTFCAELAAAGHAKPKRLIVPASSGSSMVVLPHVAPSAL